MTIKRYLFLMFSTLVLSVAIIQVVMLVLFKSTIEKEVDRRGKVFADKIVNYAVQRFDDNEVHSFSTEDIIYVEKQNTKAPKIVFVELEQEFEDKQVETTFEVPFKVLKNEQELRKVLAELPQEAQSLILKLANRYKKSKSRKIRGSSANYKVRIFKPRHSHKHSVKKRLLEEISRYKHKQNDNNLEGHTVTVKDDGTVLKTREFKANNSSKNKLLNYLFNAIIFMIVITTVISLILVFWLSKKFSHPLQKLSSGFKKLEQGEFGTKVSPTGVEEIKQTIERFNLMSDQLVKLAEAEHKLMQQTQLTELSDITKGIAHALRNPLHTIGLALEQLSQPNLPEELKAKLFTKVQNKIAQLDKNINALLTVTSGEIERSQKVDITLVTNDILLELKQSHHTSEPELKVSLDIEKDLNIVGSDKEIRTILHTLIFNAYEAAVGSQVNQIDIRVIATAANKGIEINITDNGGGLNADVEERMFAPHNSSKAEGAGMGLYISKRIAELYYNGDLTIQNFAETDGAKAILSLNSPESKE